MLHVRFDDQDAKCHAQVTEHVHGFQDRAFVDAQPACELECSRTHRSFGDRAARAMMVQAFEEARAGDLPDDLGGDPAHIIGVAIRPGCRVALKGEMTNPTKSMVMLCC